MRRLVILSSVLLIPAAAHAAPGHATRANPATRIINQMVLTLNFLDDVRARTK